MARRALRGGGRRPLPAGRSGDPAGAAAAALARDGGGAAGPAADPPRRAGAPHEKAGKVRPGPRGGPDAETRPSRLCAPSWLCACVAG